ncbi:hypothetical protein GCM10027294_24590 [Marinactinospora endophytica]
MPCPAPRLARAALLPSEAVSPDESVPVTTEAPPPSRKRSGRAGDASDRVAVREDLPEANVFSPRFDTEHTDVFHHTGFSGQEDFHVLGSRKLQS